jgi:hypothetical protein
MPINAAFDWAGPGVTASRTWPIAPDSGSLYERWRGLRRAQDAAAMDELFLSERDRNVQSIIKVPLGKFKTRPTPILNDMEEVVEPVKYGFRSLDRQWIPPDNRLISMARPRLWESLSASQFFITAPEDVSPSSGPAITITELVPDKHHYANRGGRVYPLWRRRCLHPLLEHLCSLYVLA